MSEVEKYRRAGVVVQSALAYVLQRLNTNIGDETVGDVCRAADEFLLKQVECSYKSVEEKGIALPVDISKADFVSGVSPEQVDVFQGGVINDGDVVSVALGVHIDGYTVLAAHTVVVREGTPAEPWAGPEADACVGSYLAVEAVLSLLSVSLSENHQLHGSIEVTGARIRQIVDEIAAAYDLVVVPGSRVRRIRRFIAGQPTVRERDSKAVEWLAEGQVAGEDFKVSPGEAYIVDIQMASASGEEGYVKLVEFNGFGDAVEKPTVYSRDYTVAYALKTPNARQLLTKVDKQSVYPLKLSYLSESEGDLRSLRLGLREVVQRHLLVPHPTYQARFVSETRKQGRAATVAREMATVLLIPGKDSASGFPELVRLSGGKQFPPSWLHSKYGLPDDTVAGKLLAARAERQEKLTGVRWIDVVGKLRPDNQEQMDIE